MLSNAKNGAKYLEFSEVARLPSASLFASASLLLRAWRLPVVAVLEVVAGVIAAALVAGVIAAALVAGVIAGASLVAAAGIVAAALVVDVDVVVVVSWVR